MKTCPYCGNAIEDNASFCTTCGHQLGAQNQPYPQPNPLDHTAEFAPEDVCQNKLFAASAYLFGFIGIAIALLHSKDSAYLNFHIKEALKIAILSSITAIVTLALCWTILVPIAGVIFAAILEVVSVIQIVRVFQNKSIEAPIISSFNFLK